MSTFRYKGGNQAHYHSSTSKYLASEVLKQADLSPGYQLEDLNVQAHHPYSEIALKCSS